MKRKTRNQACSVGRTRLARLARVELQDAQGIPADSEALPSPDSVPTGVTESGSFKGSFKGSEEQKQPGVGAPAWGSRAWVVAVLDRSNLRIYRLEYAARRPRLALVAAQVFPDARLPDCAVYSGEPGAFAPPGLQGLHRRQGSMPERHLDIEAGRRAARQLGRRLNTWIEQLDPGRWCLALPGELEGGVLRELAPRARGRLLEVVPRNLVRVLHSGLLGHFPRLGLWVARHTHGG